VPAQLKFLVIDEDNDSRFLLVKTLLRKFPGAAVIECRVADAALSIARTDKLSLIVTHRTAELAGSDLVRALREINSTVPIVMVSSIDRCEAAQEAGASTFLLYDEWLRIGTVVEELLQRSSLPSPRFVARN
jgi:DNA-binding NtrC family response regulator